MVKPWCAAQENVVLQHRGQHITCCISTELCIAVVPSCETFPLSAHGLEFSAGTPVHSQECPPHSTLTAISPTMSEDTTLLTAVVSHTLPSLDTHMQWTNLHCWEEGLLLVLQCNDVPCSCIQQCSCQHSKPWVHFHQQHILQTRQTLRNLLCAQAPARERVVSDRATVLLPTAGVAHAMP